MTRPLRVVENRKGERRSTSEESIVAEREALLKLIEKEATHRRIPSLAYRALEIRTLLVNERGHPEAHVNRGIALEWMRVVRHYVRRLAKAEKAFGALEKQGEVTLMQFHSHLRDSTVGWAVVHRVSMHVWGLMEPRYQARHGALAAEQDRHHERAYDLVVERNAERL